MTLAFAHAPGDAALPALPHGVDLLLSWTLDPTFLVPLAVAWLYFRGWRSYKRHGRALFRGWRPVMFALGIGFTGVALLSPVDALADYSFTWHMVQHMLITHVSVPLILLGAPFLPVVRGIPARFRRKVFVPFAQNAAVRTFFRGFTHPGVGFLSYVFILWGWHYPAAYNLALDHDLVHYLEHFCFVIVSVQMYWHVVNPYPFTSRMHYLVRMGFLFVIAVQNSALGAMITFADSALYEYEKLTSFWGLTMLDDQVMGGLLMWVGGGMMHLAVILILFIVYAVEEERKEPHHPLYVGQEKTLRPA